jgi:hypothetical protein
MIFSTNRREQFDKLLIDPRKQNRLLPTANIVGQSRFKQIPKGDGRRFIGRRNTADHLAGAVKFSG